MPDLKLYSLFISHAWRYNEEYYKLENLLNNANYFYWRNYSVPTHDPLVDPDTHVGEKKLTAMLDEQIKHVNCVLVLAGMYSAYHEWIKKEIEISKSYGKPIIGVIPWGQERTPQYVLDNSKIMVGWNTDSIVGAVRNYSL